MEHKLIERYGKPEASNRIELYFSNNFYWIDEYKNGKIDKRGHSPNPHIAQTIFNDFVRVLKDQPRKKIQQQGNTFRLAVKTDRFYYYVNWQGDDDNTNVVVIDKNMQLVSNNFVASSAFLSLLDGSKNNEKIAWLSPRAQKLKSILRDL